MDTQLSEHFSRKEFACRCGCGAATVDAELLVVLERIREAFGPVVITSGHRCFDHNKAVGGAKRSQHVMGCAVDFKVIGGDLKEIHEVLLDWYQGKYGIARGNTFIHIDTRTWCSRWEY